MAIHLATPLEAAGAQVTSGSHPCGHPPVPSRGGHDGGNDGIGSPGFYVDPDTTRLELIAEEKVRAFCVVGAWIRSSWVLVKRIDALPIDTTPPPQKKTDMSMKNIVVGRPTSFFLKK